MKKIVSVFKKDLRISSRDPLALWLILAPILIAFIILLISPGVQDSALSIAMLNSADPAHVTYFEDVAKVTQFDTVKAIEERVGRRDNVIGIVTAEGYSEIIAQGNEPKEIIDSVKTVNALYELRAKKSETRMTLNDFNQTVSPLKKMLASSLLLMVTVLAGMMISMGIVDEKADKSIRASNVTPLTQLSYIIGKSLMGIVTLLIGSFCSLLILGFLSINWMQMLLILFAASLLSIIIGFAIGVVSNDFIEAAGTLKLLTLPLFGSVLVYELVPLNWQWTVWWSPFYWDYQGAVEIIHGSAQWSSILLYTGIVMVITLLVYVGLSPRIRKGLN